MSSPTIMHVVNHLAGLPDVRRIEDDRVLMYVKDGFLTGKECRRLCSIIDAERQPSGVVHPNGDAHFRTSETCHMRQDIPLVAEIDDRICRLLHLNPLWGEGIQGQRYGVGQQFKAHTDFFKAGTPGYEEHTGHTGQRTWTVMIYLDRPERGGETIFTSIGRTFEPEVGKLLAWSNQNPDGSVNEWTLHHATSILSGEKHVVTKWFRERPNV